MNTKRKKKIKESSFGLWDEKKQGLTELKFGDFSCLLMEPEKAIKLQIEPNTAAWVWLASSHWFRMGATENINLDV
jgi:hypothetical protein